MGTHTELLNQEGMYKTLVQRQMIGNAGDGGHVVEASRPKRSSATAPYYSSSRGPGSGTLSISPPHSMAQSLLATSFTQSTTSMQSK